jgi:hypothetical protein
MERGDSRKSSIACLRFGFVALASVLLTNSPIQGAAATQAAGATPTRADLIACEIAWDELVAGGPLTPDERQQVAEAVDLDIRANATAVLKGYARWSKVLQNAARDTARLIIIDAATSPDRFDQENQTQTLRQQLRYAIETAPSLPGFERGDAIENAIIRRHDPTVLLDTARKHIVSELDLRFLYDASVWYAQRIGLSGPSADFKNHLQVWLKKNYQNLNAIDAESWSQAPQNFLWLANAFKKPENIEASRQHWRARLQVADASARDVTLAQAVANDSHLQQTYGSFNQRMGQIIRANAGVMLQNATSQALHGRSYRH